VLFYVILLLIFSHGIVDKRAIFVSGRHPAESSFRVTPCRVNSSPTGCRPPFSVPRPLTLGVAPCSLRESGAKSSAHFGRTSIVGLLCFNGFLNKQLRGLRARRYFAVAVVCRVGLQSLLLINCNAFRTLLQQEAKLSLG